MNIERFFISAYREQDFITQSKAKIFLYYSFLMFILLGLLVTMYALMPLPAELSHKGMAGGFGIIVLVLISLFVLRSGKLDRAVWAYALPTILIVAIIRYINAGVSPATAFTTYIYYMPYLIVFVAVFGRRWHVPVTTVFFAVTNLTVWLRVRDASGMVADSATTGIINSSIGILVTGVVAYSMVNIMEKYNGNLRKEAEIAAGKVEKLKAAMDAAHEGLNVGSHLLRESASMERAAGEIEQHIAGIRREMSSLGEDVRSTKDANGEIAQATAVLSQSSEAYQSMAIQASAAVTEMTASIESISGVSSRNKASVEALAESIGEGMEKADTSAKNISLISSNSETLLDAVSVISAISGQINMLAMNAAIEAAHAGDSGKGFAVVADEIRRLAEETEENSRTITSGLETFTLDVRNAEAANVHIDAAFKEISAGIKRTQGAFEEILAGMTDLSTGTKDINRAVADVVSSSQGVAASIRTTDSMIKKNSGAIEDVMRKTTLTMSSLDAITEGFLDILTQAGNVQSLGKQSEAVISGLDESIRGLSS